MISFLTFEKTKKIQNKKLPPKGAKFISRYHPDFSLENFNAALRSAYSIQQNAPKWNGNPYPTGVPLSPTPWMD